METFPVLTKIFTCHSNWMPCSVTITMHFSSPSNNKPVSCFVTIHGFYSFFIVLGDLSQFLDTWEWNLFFAKSSKSCGKLESSFYWQVQEQLGQEHNTAPSLSHNTHRAPVAASSCKVTNTHLSGELRQHQSLCYLLGHGLEFCAASLDTWRPGKGLGPESLRQG